MYKTQSGIKKYCTCAKRNLEHKACITLMYMSHHPTTNCGSTLFCSHLPYALCLGSLAVPFSACTCAGPKIVFVPSHLSFCMFVCTWKIIILFIHILYWKIHFLSNKFLPCLSKVIDILHRTGLETSQYAYH